MRPFYQPVRRPAFSKDVPLGVVIRSENLGSEALVALRLAQDGRSCPLEIFERARVPDPLGFYAKGCEVPPRDPGVHAVCLHDGTSA